MLLIRLSLLRARDPDSYTSPALPGHPSLTLHSGKAYLPQRVRRAWQVQWKSRKDDAHGHEH